MIVYANPFRSDLNIGKSYNEFIEFLNVPDESWIVIQDGDICYLTPDWGKRIEDAINLDGDKFGLVGCYTNRIKEPKQCHEFKFSDDSDIKNHIAIAQGYQGEGIQEVNFDIAGLFMAFQKKTWSLVGGFKENDIACDFDFNRRVRAQKLKVGLIRSLYVWHTYRIWADNPWNSKGIRHLMKGK